MYCFLSVVFGVFVIFESITWLSNNPIKSVLIVAYMYYFSFNLVLFSVSVWRELLSVHREIISDRRNANHLLFRNALSLSLPVCLSHYLSLSPLSVSLPLSFCLPDSPSKSISLFLCLSVRLSLLLSTFLSTRL